MNQPTTLPQVAVGYIRGHQVAGRFMESLLTTMLWDSHTWNIIQGRIIPQHCAHYLNVGRNALAKRFCDQYASECEVFVSLDTDHGFNPADVAHIVSLVDPVTRPVVSGLYYACDDLGAQVRPIVLRRKADGSLDTVWEFAANDLVEVDVVGMGFCAIHRDVLLRIRELAGDHWFDFDETEAGDFMPEDNAFCRRVTEYLGHKIYVHTGIEIGHVKTFELTGKNKQRRATAQASDHSNCETRIRSTREIRDLE